VRFDWNVRPNLQLRSELAEFRAADDPRSGLTDATRVWLTLSWTVY
jgi:hypothetical protein